MKIFQQVNTWEIGLAFVSMTAAAEEIPFSEENWTLSGQTAEFREFRGRSGIYLENGRAVLKDRTFENGIIEFDIAFDEDRGFMGINFRVQDQENYETFYFRSHQSGNDDANQYTPSFNGLTGWQIYYGPQYSTPISYKFNEWMHVKVLVKGDRAEFYLDDEEPFLHIGDLLQENTEGQVSLSSFFNGAYFANFEITENADVTQKGETVPHDPLPENLVESWDVATSAFSSESLADKGWLSPEDLADYQWTSLAVEANGRANLARVNGVSEEADTVYVRLKIHSDRDQVKELRFGFSDRYRAFVNGALVAGGNDTYRTRDYRFLGTIGLFDSLFLHLNEGENEIVFAIGEAFGGWAIMGAFADMEGIRILN